jgi:hypothetical protein
MKKSCLLPLMLTLALAAGCTPIQLDNAQFTSQDEATQKAMTRTYQDFTQEQLTDAAEKALMHSDKEYQVSRIKGGLTAARHWTLFLVTNQVEGNDNWDITVGRGAVKAVAWYAGGSVGLPGSATSIPANSADDPYLSPPLYNLFFDRMEYFLGLRSDWAPCVQVDVSKFHRAEGLKNGGNDPLCFMAKAQDPTKAK